MAWHDLLLQEILEEFSFFTVLCPPITFWRFKNADPDEYLAGLAMRPAPPTVEAIQAHHEKWSQIRRLQLRRAKEQAPRKCPVCGSNMTYKRSNAKVCSRKCKNKLRRSNGKG